MWWEKKSMHLSDILIQHIHREVLTHWLKKQNPTIQLSHEFIGYIFLAQWETTWKLQNLPVSQLKKKNKTFTSQPMAWQAVFICILCICIWKYFHIYKNHKLIHKIEMPVVAGDLSNLSPWPDYQSLEDSGQPPAVGPCVCSPTPPTGPGTQQEHKTF